MTWVTGGCQFFLQSLSGMARKAVAGVLLIAIAVWAEMALAPMLALLASPMHVGHTLPVQVASQHVTHHQAVPAKQADKHSCCPPVPKINEAAGMLELMAESSDCQDSHRCCFRQGPRSLPAPVSEARQFGPHVRLTTPTEATQAGDGSYSVITEPPAPPPYPQIFGMTLRV